MSEELLSEKLKKLWRSIDGGATGRFSEVVDMAVAMESRTPAPSSLSQWTDRDLLIGGTRYKAGSITVADVLDHAARASDEFYADDDELSEEDRHMVDRAWEKHKSAAPKFLATEDGEFNGDIAPERETVTLFVPDGYSSAAEFVKDCGFETATTPQRSAASSATDLLAWLRDETSLELSFERWEEDGRWQVHEIRGGRNDQEWSLLGSGDTPEQALSAAKIALEVRKDAKAATRARNQREHEAG